MPKHKTAELRTWRLSKANVVRFADLHQRLKRDTENGTFNYIIECFYLYETHKDLIDALLKLKLLLKQKVE